MLDWLKFNKNYPDFWKFYLDSIDKKSNRIVILTTQTSGYNTNSDVILNIGAIAINANKIDVGDSFEVNILQKPVPNSIDNINDSAFNTNSIGIEQHIAIENFIKFISNATIVGHRIDFDIEMINVALKKMNCGDLKNQALDLEVMYRKLKKISDNKNIEIKEIMTTYNIEKSDRNNVIFDAYDLSIVFLKLKNKLRF